MYLYIIRDKYTKILIMKKYVVTLIAILMVFFSGCDIASYFQHKYYKKSYHPKEIVESEVSLSVPKEYQILDAPCISYEKGYCHSTSLQMVSARFGVTKNIHYYNWIMGFTYSAFFNNYAGITSFWPINDPELGLEQGCPHVGLKRTYYTSSDKNIYIKAIKSYISKAYPVRVAVNSATLYKRDGFYGHSIILIGYNKDSVHYYETGGQNRNLLNYTGEKTDWNTLMKSVESISVYFNYPWKYSLNIFEQISSKEDIKDILRYNGKSLQGNKYGPVSTGSKAIKALAIYISKHEISERGWEHLKLVTDIGRYSRIDNADFINLHFPANNNMQVAALELRRSGENFEEILSLLKNKENNKAIIIELLISSSNLENEAGKILIDFSKQNSHN